MSPSKLILGTVQFGLDYGINNVHGKPQEDEVFNILKSASEHGVSLLDTAMAYGNSEELIGSYHRQQEGQPFEIITKFHAKGTDNPELLLEAALQRLGVDRLDTLLFHSFADYEGLRGTIFYEFLQDLVGRKVGRIGVSVYTNEEIAVLLQDQSVEVVQAPFNLFDNEVQRANAFKELQKAGKEVHTRSVFLQGLFFKKASALPEKLKPLSEALNTIWELSEELQCPVGQLAMQYALSKSYIDKVLFGVDTTSQLESNMNWVSTALPEEAFLQIDKLKIADVDLLSPSNW